MQDDRLMAELLIGVCKKARILIQLPWQLNLQIISTACVMYFAVSNSACTILGKYQLVMKLSK